MPFEMGKVIISQFVAGITLSESLMSIEDKVRIVGLLLARCHRDLTQDTTIIQSSSQLGDLRIEQLLSSLLDELPESFILFAILITAVNIAATLSTKPPPSFCKRSASYWRKLNLYFPLGSITLTLSSFFA